MMWADWRLQPSGRAEAGWATEALTGTRARTGGEAAGQTVQREGREHTGNKDQKSQPYTDEVTREQRANRQGGADLMGAR